MAMNSTHPSVASHRTRWLKRLLFLLPALGVAGLVWWLNQAPRSVPTTYPADTKVEMLRTELELKSGRLHRIGSTNLFTGLMLERYADGALRSRSTVTHGLLHGLSEGRYPNGQVQVTEQFTEGVSHGLRTKWYPDGAKLSEATIVEGKLHGPFRRWHPNGELAEDLQLKEGQPDGLSKAYFPSGSMKSRTTMQNGKVVEQKLWKDGEYKDTTAEIPATASSAKAL